MLKNSIVQKMFPILSEHSLRAVDWSTIHGVQTASTVQTKGSKRNLDSISTIEPKVNEEDVRISTGFVLLNETVSTDNPSSHAVYVNTWPRFREYEERIIKIKPDVVSVKITNTQKPSIQLTATQFYDTFVKRTQAECDAEREAKQGTQEWLDVRKLSITASVFGAAAGSNPYQTPNDLLEEKLWGTFNGNALTVWGNEHEPHARESFVAWFKELLSARYFFAGRTDDPVFELKEDNAIKFAAEPWLAVSPDGILYYEDADGTKKVSLVEFKCPTRDNVDPTKSPYSKYENGIPPYYKDQVQGICGYLNENKYCSLPFQDIWFVVWRPSKTWITHLEADSKYYQSYLKPKLFSWYFKQYLPALTKKYNSGNVKEVEDALQL